MKPAYEFGHTQEDERTEARALGLPGGRALSITSAGEMALDLLALGAETVVGVDLAPSQNHLARLKKAAVLGLAREDAMRFLGYLPAARAQRLDWLRALVGQLPPTSRAFWSEHRDEAARGVIWRGRFERFLHVLLRVLAPVLQPRFVALFDARTVDEQQRVFAEQFDVPVVRALFRLAFHPRVYGGRGVDRRSVQFHDPSVSLGDQFFGRFRAACLGSPARQNVLLQLFTLGRVVDASVAPAYLTEAGARIVRSRPDSVSFVDGDVTEHLLGQERGTYDRLHLSNVPDWMARDRFDALMRAVVDRAARPAWLVWRFIHVDWPLPADVARVIHPDRALGAELEAEDRFPIYTVVPARIDASEEVAS